MPKTLTVIFSFKKDSYNNYRPRTLCCCFNSDIASRPMCYIFEAIIFRKVSNS